MYFGLLTVFKSLLPKYKKPNHQHAAVNFFVHTPGELYHNAVSLLSLSETHRRGSLTRMLAMAVPIFHQPHFNDTSFHLLSILAKHEQWQRANRAQCSLPSRSTPGHQPQSFKTLKKAQPADIFRDVQRAFNAAPGHQKQQLF